MDNRLQLILPALIMIVLAGLFEGAETGIYRLSRLRLRLAVEKNRWSAALLERVMRDNVGLLLSLLVGTNVAGCSPLAGEYLTLISSASTMFQDTSVILSPASPEDPRRKYCRSRNPPRQARWGKYLRTP